MLSGRQFEEDRKEDEENHIKRNVWSVNDGQDKREGLSIDVVYQSIDWVGELTPNDFSGSSVPALPS